MERYDFDATRIFNVDEAGISTVHKPPKVIAKKGARQVGATTSGERGVNTTVVCCCNAAGTYIPPMILFKRKRMVEILAEGAPPCSLVVCNESGWMDKELFTRWLQHFVSWTKPTA